MNFALLGYQPAVQPLLEAIAADGACRLLCAWGTLPADVFESAPGVRRVADWSELLAPGTIEAAIVAHGDEETRTAAKHLFATGRGLIVVPHPGLDTAWMYELSLQQVDAQAPLMPYFPHRAEANVRRLRAAIAAGTIGRARSIEMSRLVDTAQRPRELLTAEEIDAALLCDADLLRFLGGRYTQVTALRTGESGGGCLRAQIVLAGAGLPEAVWTVRPRSAEAGGDTLAVVGEKGIAAIDSRGLNGDRGGGRLSINGEPQPPDPLSPVGHAAEILAAFRGIRAPDDGDATWDDLIRAGETVEAARDSIRRRRTIDLHTGEHSEQTVFKSQMTAMGCGVLLLTLAAVIVVAMLDAAFQFPQGARGLVQGIVFLPVFLFLLLQLLYFAARPRGDKARGG